MAKKDELLVELNEKYEKGLDNKTDAEQNALININFINGKQHIRYNKTLKVIEEITPENSVEYREKEVFNRIRPFRNTVISKIKDKMPEPQVVPYTQDDEDLDVSKATNAMLKDLFNRQKVTKKLKKAAIDCVDIGPAFLHIKWDPKAGTVLMSDLDALLGDSAALVSPQQKQEMIKKLDANNKLRSGDVVIEYIDMFEILVADAFEQDIQEQPWIMRVKSYSKDEAEKLFGTDAIETETVGHITMGGSRRGMMNDTLEENLGVYNTERKSDVVVAKEYFEKPSTIHPNGRHIIFVGQKIVEQGDLPYINGEFNTRVYPFVKIGLDTPNLFYSHAFIEDMKAVQRRYNQVRNRKYEYITKNVHGQLAIEIGSIDDEQEISNKPGSVIWYNRGYTPPTTLKAGSTGTLDVDSELSSLGNEFIEMTGISTLSTQGTPDTSAVRGAGMVQMLMESDDSKFSLIVDALVDAVIELSKQAVRLYKQFMLPQEVRFTRFTKDLTTVVNWHRDLLVEDIDIKNRIQLSTTDTRRKQDLQSLMQSGLLTAESQLGLGPDLTMKLIEQMDIGISIDEMPVAGYSDVKKARRENRLITMQGAQIDADQYDNHNIHYDIHTNFIKSDEYRKMVIANPMIDQLVRYHIDQHGQIVEKQRQQAQAQAIAEQNMKNK